VPDYRAISFWHETAGTIRPRPGLRRNDKVDVAIVGGGFTGLWTAYYLAVADPGLRIAVVEAEVAGFGASGRNGGWCSALFPTSAARLARDYGRDAACAQYAAMRASVDEVGRVCAHERIDADFAKGGVIVLARNSAQLARARSEVDKSDEFGLGSELLDTAGASDRLAATDVLGGVYSPHCAVVHPARLARGLAEAVERRGVSVFEQTRASSVGPGMVRTPGGTLRADVVVRATEAYTSQLPGGQRSIAPVYSLMIATEPLTEDVWVEIGLANRETFSDGRHLIIYGQRTGDGRLVFGGRGAPYHFRSRIDSRFDRSGSVFTNLERTLVELFPVLEGVRITHRWGGPLGLARDWRASVGLVDGLAWAGGYVGDGVSTANLAGRTLTALITATPSELTTLPWVGHRSPDWEPEPLRWLAVNAGLLSMNWADRAETRSGRPSRLAEVIERAIGR